VSQLLWPLLTTSDKGRMPAVLPLTDAPLVDAQPIDEDAATLVLVRYTVPADKRTEFLAALKLVKRSRQRTGARQWQAYDDRERPGVIVEAFWLGSWREHIAQHETRATEYDQKVLDAARAFSTEPVEAEHLIEAL